MSARFFAVIGLAVLASSFAIPAGAGIEEQMGPQVFSEPSVESAGGDDPKIVTAVESAVAVARKYQFRYDASESPKGRVVVTALWKGRPIKLTMRIFWKGGALTIASMLSQPGDLSLKKRGEKIEGLYYRELVAETTRRGLQLSGDPDERP